MRAHLSKQGHQIARGEAIRYMRKFLGDSVGKKNAYCFFFPPLSVHINLLGEGAERLLCLKASRSPSPWGTASDLILLANVVRGRLYLPQYSSELLIGPSELIKR